MPTPVGPAPGDPNDPDLWDWSGAEEPSAPRRRPGRALLAVAIVVLLVLFLVATFP